MQVSKSDSGDFPPEDDPDSVVVEYVDFIKVKNFFPPLLKRVAMFIVG